jgi:putative sigma-54 modulation protein
LQLVLKLPDGFDFRHCLNQLKEIRMQVAVTCRHGSINSELRDYIIRKSEKIVRYLDQVSEIDVTIEFEGPRVNVEMLVEIDGYHTIVAHVEGEDTGATFDKTLHKMEQQVHRHKEKKRDHRRDKPLSDVLPSDIPEPPNSAPDAGKKPE